MKALIEEVSRELTNDILPFWLGKMDDGAGAWIGRIDGKGTPHPDSERGCIMYARILWTFSSAYRLTGVEQYLDAATRTRDYILDHFIDREYGGAYWCLKASGEPLDTKKQIYAIAFAIYGLAEYARATGSDPSEAIALFRSVEEHSLDRVKGGYLEAFKRDWSPIGDMRLSAKDRNDAKTMNTHLHVLEAYTALCRVWDSPEIRGSLRSLIEVFMGKIIRPDGHLGLFFDEDWHSTSRMISYGHEIETSWLLCEAASVLSDDALTARVRDLSTKMAEASLEGFSEGMIYEYDPESGAPDVDRHWWVQAETVVGCINQWRITGSTEWLDRAESVWDFIKAHIICPEGEWYWSARPSDGGFVANLDDDRAGFWKCPYHNGRMCMELMDCAER